jgi:HAD superfamily hydrolase (TIGR01509 family)
MPTNCPERYQAILFDMDGTLIDSEPLWLASEVELMAKYGYQWTLADQQQCLGGPLSKVGDYMSEKAAGAAPAQFFIDTMISAVEASLESDLIFMPGAIELVDELHQLGYPLALVTASPRNLLRATLAGLPFNYFSATVSSNDVTKTKPHPESYLRAAKMLQVDISQCLVVEDSRTGVRSGLASGACVVGIEHLLTFEPEDRLVRIDSLADLDATALLALHTNELG